MGLWKKMAEQGKLYGIGKAKVKRRKDKHVKSAATKQKRYLASNARKNFYTSPEWRALRYRALKLHAARCVVCNRDRSDGLKLHVDHIVPRSKAPHLSLELSNLQIMCEDCNMGKSNTDRIDWRDGAATK